MRRYTAFDGELSAMRRLAVLVAVASIAVAAGPPARAAGPASGPSQCFWNRPNDPDVVNAAYPDKAATYWAGRPLVPSGAELIMHGSYPHARYMSFNAYNAQAQPVDGLADVAITPDPGSTNPFVAGADRDAVDRSYTLRVVPGPTPSPRAPNTLYLDAPILIYRVYVPDDGRDLAGYAGLPAVTLRLADGTTTDLTANCAQDQATTPAASQLGALPVQSAFRDNALPGPPLSLIARDPVHWEKFFNLQHMHAATATDGTAARPVVDDNLASSGGGYLSNTDNSYAVALASRALGPVLVLHGRAPVTPRTKRAPSVMPAGEMRYWSLCTNDRHTTRFVDCSIDEDVPLDADGWYTVVVSAPADRPANAVPACGAGWLAWGIAPETLVILRHMLPDAGFAHAIQRVERPADLGVIVGEYLPEGRHTSKEAYEARGC
jgi:hypothetical protein